MITKEELQAVHQQMKRERRAVPPPTAEEVLAYVNGELSGEEEERVREALVDHPDMARAAVIDFPTDEAKPGDDGYLSEHELARRWVALRKQMHADNASSSLRAWRVSTALAAAVALALGILLWQAEIRARNPRVIIDRQLLLPDGQRGATSTEAMTVTAHGDTYLLVAPIVGLDRYDRYRVDLLSGTRTIWRSESLPAPENDAFAIVVPRSLLPAGRYEIALYGINGTTDQSIATYSIVTK